MPLILGWQFIGYIVVTLALNTVSLGVVSATGSRANGSVVIILINYSRFKRGTVYRLHDRNMMFTLVCCLFVQLRVSSGVFAIAAQVRQTNGQLFKLQIYFLSG